jgi:hypothetical protein
LTPSLPLISPAVAAICPERPRAPVLVIFCLNPSGQRQLEASPSFLAASVLFVSP